MENQNRSKNRSGNAGRQPVRRKAAPANGQRRSKNASSSGGRQAGNSRSETVRMSAEKRKKLKRRRDTFIVCLLLVMLCALAAVLSTTVFFKASDIIVNNQSDLYPEDRIADASGLSVGDNMLTAKLDKASDAIEKALPYIRVATVRRKWPDAFFIDAEYADAVLAVRKGGAYVYIDIDGKVLETDIAQPDESAALVNGAYADSAIPGNPVTLTDEKALNTLLTVVTALHDNGVRNITAIDIANPTDIVVELDHRIEVKLGAASNIAERMIEFGKAVIEKNMKEGSDEKLIIDLSTGSKAFVRVKEEPTEPTTKPLTPTDAEEDEDYDENYDEDYDEEYDEDYDEDDDEDYDGDYDEDDWDDEE